VLRRWPGPFRIRPGLLRRWVVPVVAYLVAAVVLTWPLARHLSSRLPLGVEDTATVPQFNLWTMQWNGSRLAHLYSGYWNAPIFHPTRGSFALSDPQPLTGAIATGLHAVVGNHVAVYGLVLLGALVLDGVGAMLLADRFGAPRPAAWLTGLLALALPFVFHELGVLQLAMVFPFFFVLVALHDLGARPTSWAGARIGLWTGVAFLTSEYYGLFLVVFLTLGIPFTLGRRLGTRVVLGPLLVALGVAAVLSAPMLVGQAHFTERYRWTTATVTDNSAAIADYASLDPGALGGSFAPWLRGDTVEHLYPGTGLEVLAVAGFAVATATGQRRWAAFLGAGALLAVLLSLGLRLEIGGFAPYSALRDHLPGFSRLRSPFRFAVVAQVVMVGLATFAVRGLWSWRGRTGQVLVALVVVFAVAEVAFLPASLARPLPDFAAMGWVRFLQRHPGGTVAMVPFPEANAVEAYEPTTAAMLAAREHGHALVNGYSGFFPTQYFDLREVMQAFPAEGVPSLQVRDVRWVVVDRAWLEEGRTRELASTPGLTRAYADRRAVVYRLSASAGAGG
jgi:hypothetical protein